MTRPTVSVVAPLFNEAENVARLVAELLAVLRPLGEPFEIVLVDDGSSDETWQRIQDAARPEPAVRGVSLLRNFGHQSALLAGLAQASGRAVISMDGDLQHPPALIPELLAAWREGARVVNTRRLDSEDTGWFKRWSSRAFYRVFSALSGIDLPPGSSDFRLLDAEIVDAVLKTRDPEPFLRGLIHWLGGPAATVAFRARPRHAGLSKFDLRRMARLSVQGLVSFSTVPLRLGIWAGLFTSALAFAEILYILVQYARGQTVPGWASALTVVSFMFGVLFILLGILGTYLASIHQAIRNRPLYLVGRTVGAAGDGGRARSAANPRWSAA
ncbi:MAG: glycosyltransferase family 2 protein [Thermoanaerobaculia bacterium]|nr:MAG: glycosyltransferase family 2 protein [Thermoanaerobaculia bacterium]